MYIARLQTSSEKELTAWNGSQPTAPKVLLGLGLRNAKQYDLLKSSRICISEHAFQFLSSLMTTMCTSADSRSDLAWDAARNPWFPVSP
jgi:hypothetical protein